MISEKIPEGFAPELEVVSCYVIHDGKILMLQRHPEHKHSSKWGLPAGKIDPGETKETAVQREIREETGLDLSRQDLHYQEVLFVSHSGKEFLYYVFHTKLLDKPEVRLNPPEHKRYDWFTLDQVLSLDLIHDLDACLKRHYRGLLQPA